MPTHHLADGVLAGARMSCTCAMNAALKPYSRVSFYELPQLADLPRNEFAANTLTYNLRDTSNRRIVRYLEVMRMAETSPLPLPKADLGLAPRGEQAHFEYFFIQVKSFPNAA
jgi:hypothetical protein